MLNNSSLQWDRTVYHINWLSGLLATFSPFLLCFFFFFYLFYTIFSFLILNFIFDYSFLHFFFSYYFSTSSSPFSLSSHFSPLFLFFVRGRGRSLRSRPLASTRTHTHREEFLRAAEKSKREERGVRSVSKMQRAIKVSRRQRMAYHREDEVWPDSHRRSHLRHTGEDRKLGERKKEIARGVEEDITRND